MNADLARLERWIRRASPARADLARALVAGLIASLTNVALLVGAVGLLVASAARPGLSAILGALIALELFAFFRSPLRYAERMSAHRLGFDAVTRWRRWLVEVIGALDYSRWRRYASGDLLERALRDTDELQDLWLRSVVPLITTLTVMVVSDTIVGLLAPHGAWWRVAVAVFAVQLVGVSVFATNFTPLIKADRAVRRTRGEYRATLVELSSAAPALTRLGRSDFVRDRSEQHVTALRAAERRLRARRRSTELIGPIATLVAVGAMSWHPRSAPVWLIVAVMVALSTLEAMHSVRGALDAAVAVSGGAERLEELDPVRRSRTLAWPSETTMRLEHVNIDEGATAIVRDASLEVAPGQRVAIVGVSGAGKSTVLRAIAALDPITSGVISVGAIPIEQINEGQLRRALTYVPSEPGLVRGFVTDVLTLGRRGDRDATADLAAMGVVAQGRDHWESLSRGETARVAIARAMVTSPRIYLLDEPTSGLGEDETAAVLDLLAGTGASVIIATHDAQVMAWCDEIYHLADARLSRLSR